MPKVSRKKNAVAYFGLNGSGHFLALTEFERRLAEFYPATFFVRVTDLRERQRDIGATREPTVGMNVIGVVTLRG